jgi:pyrroline-5-carboxylate reductase
LNAEANMCEEISRKVAHKLAFIGVGRIAQVWIDRLIQTGAIGSEDWMACDNDEKRLERICQDFGHKLATRDPVEAVRFGRLIIVATPPAEVVCVLTQVRADLSPDHVVISLAAGIPMAALESALGDVPVVRVMPNTPALVGEAMNLVVFGRTVSQSARTDIENLLDVLGVWHVVDDRLMDSWCALCAVGPTYLFPVVEALSAAAAAKGIPLEQAIDAASQVLVGVGCLIQGSGKDIPELKEMIGLHTLREDDAKKLFAEAYDEAVRKLEALAMKFQVAAGG